LLYRFNFVNFDFLQIGHLSFQVLDLVLLDLDIFLCNLEVQVQILHLALQLLVLLCLCSQIDPLRVLLTLKGSDFLALLLVLVLQLLDPRFDDLVVLRRLEGQLVLDLHQLALVP